MSAKVIRIFCCDPGSQFFGWALLEYDLSTGRTTAVKYGTITGKSLLKQKTDLHPFFEKRALCLWALEEALTTMFEEMSPLYIVSESPFMHRFVQTFVVLTLIVQAIRTAARRTVGRDIYLIAPKESKQTISKSGTSDKQAVQDAIFNDPSIVIKNLKSNQAELTEHVYDGIAAGVTFIRNYLPAILAAEKITS